MRISNWLIPLGWTFLFIIELIAMCYGNNSCPWILAIVPTAFTIYTSCENAIIEDLIDNGTIQFEQKEDKDEIK